MTDKLGDEVLKLYKGLKSYVKQLILMVLLLFVQAFSMLMLPSMMSLIIDRGSFRAI